MSTIARAPTATLPTEPDPIGQALARAYQRLLLLAEQAGSLTPGGQLDQAGLPDEHTMERQAEGQGAP